MSTATPLPSVGQRRPGTPLAQPPTRSDRPGAHRGITPPPSVEEILAEVAVPQEPEHYGEEWPDFEPIQASVAPPSAVVDEAEVPDVEQPETEQVTAGPTETEAEAETETETDIVAAAPEADGADESGESDDAAVPVRQTAQQTSHPTGHRTGPPAAPRPAPRAGVPEQSPEATAVPEPHTPRPATAVPQPSRAPSAFLSQARRPLAPVRDRDTAPDLDDIRDAEDLLTSATVAEVAAAALARIRAAEAATMQHLVALEEETARRCEMLTAQAELDAELIRLHARREAHAVVAAARSRARLPHGRATEEGRQVEEIIDVVTRFAEGVDAAHEDPDLPEWR